MVVRRLAHDAVTEMRAPVESVCDEGAWLETADASMLFHKQLDTVRAGHSKEDAALSDVVLLNSERVF